MHRSQLAFVVSALLSLSFTPAYAGWPTHGLAVCTASPTQQTKPTVIKDGSGGAIIAWLDGRGCVFAQRIDALGNTMWTSDGVSICASATALVELAPDGSGGAFILWHSGGVQAQRIDGNGNLLWQSPYSFPGSGSLHDAISDGAGRVIYAAYTPIGTPSFIRVQCVDGNGVAQWTPNGVVVESGSGTLNYRWSPRLAPDGNGGAIVTWYANSGGWGYEIHAQRVDVAGVTMWGSANGGVTIAAEGAPHYDPQIVSDGLGGAVIAWWRNDTTGDIYAQRIGGTGMPLWTPNGIPVCVQPNTQDGVFLASDGAAGAIITWVDNRTGVGTDIYAQRVDATGVAHWSASGIAICDISGHQNACRVESDNAGGAFMVWADARNGGSDVYAQHVDASGNMMWAEDGVPLCAAVGAQTVPRIALVSTTDAVAVWQDARSGDADIYAHRMSTTGPTTIRDTPGYTNVQLNSAPNPFSGSTSLHLRLGVESDVSLDLFDVTGKRMSTRELGHLGAGSHIIPLDDRDAGGGLLPSGIYFCRVSASGEIATHKITIAR